MSENIKSRRKNLQSFDILLDSKKSEANKKYIEAKGANASLWLNKYIYEQKIEKGPESTAKQDLVKQVANIEVPTVYESFYKEVWLTSFEVIEQNQEKYLEKRLIEISGRMIVGLGAESVLETSITLHRAFGVPYIPGSALKGLAASYAHRFMSEDWKKETIDKTTKQKSPIGKAHELMFGSQNCAGFVIFYDALYVPDSYKRKPKNPLEPDILTVHHQKYYQGDDAAPADWDSPVPIPLLSAQGTYLLVVSANSGDVEFDGRMVNLAVNILEFALRDQGIGAKTSSGYGRAEVKPFESAKIENQATPISEIDNQQPVQKEPELTAEERQARQAQADEKRFQSIKTELEQIGNFDKQSREKFKEIRKRIRKIDQPELRRTAAEAFVEKAKSLTGRDDDELEKAYPWFEEISIILD